MDNKVGLSFKIFFFFKYMGQGVLYPFLVIFLNDKGIGGAELGLLLTLLPLGKVALAPVFIYFCDLYRIHKPMLVISLLLNTLGGYLLFISEAAFASFVFAISMITLGESISDTLGISLALDYLSHWNRQTDYGKWRLWGAVGFMLGSIFLGLYVLEKRLHFVPLVFAFANLAAGVISMAIPKGSAKKPLDWLGGLKMLKRTPSFILLLIGGVFSGMSFNIIQSYYSVYMAGLGALSWMIGVSVALQVVVEIILSANTKNIIDRFPLKFVYLFGFLILPLRNFLYWINTSPIIGLLIQNLHGFFIFSAFITGMIVLERNIKPDWRSTGQSYYNSSIGGLGGMLGSFFAPLIFDNRGISAVWLFSTVIALIGFFLVSRAARGLTTGAVNKIVDQ